MNKLTVATIKRVMSHIENGDPVEAASTLDSILHDNDSLTLDQRKTLEKAKEECEVGVSENGKTLLGLLPIG